MQAKRLYNLYVSKLHFYAKFAEEYKIICINRIWNAACNC